MSQKHISLAAAVAVLACAAAAFSQSRDPAVERGSLTAKNGFRNETEIAAKFNAWKTDDEAKVWLNFMGYTLAEIDRVYATKPHGEKADVEVRIIARGIEKKEGISIKLVSTQNGFNQIDKRRLDTYAKRWRMPQDVVESLKLFLGESRPSKPSRDTDRMFLNELHPASQKNIIDFFVTKKDAIVGDIFAGDGEHPADWLMVALKTSEKPRWVLRRIDHAIRFYADGEVAITKAGNLKIGRITMQRKGGDGGRESAKMLQFKINPALLFDK